ncbi:hypothetical protein C900_05770 [Fulvivirga imtechensis AK7]|uniref:Uncharacterized protein n=1 Tax=Fulvivirga imtechensis AK7 TaxID=1237149 RepID=L8JWH4_9BACT|nr:hypothetical protein C900_05770 [Fulvivirga imtechensis AK7]
MTKNFGNINKDTPSLILDFSIYLGLAKYRARNENLKQLYA